MARPTAASRLTSLVGDGVLRLAALPEVTWAAVVTGRYDIMTEVATEEGMNGLYDFLNVSLREVGGINSSEMFLVMKAKNRWTLMPTSMRRAWIERPADAD